MVTNAWRCVPRDPPVACRKIPQMKFSNPYIWCAINDDLLSFDLRFADQGVNQIPGLEIVDWL